MLDDEFVNGTGMARRPFSWPAMAAVIIQGVAVCGFVVAVYALLVGGGIALWPRAGDTWILLLWIAAAAGGAACRGNGRTGRGGMAGRAVRAAPGELVAAAGHPGRARHRGG